MVARASQQAQELAPLGNVMLLGPPWCPRLSPLSSSVFPSVRATRYRHFLFQFHEASVKKRLPYLFSRSRDGGHSVGSSSASKFSLKVSMGLSSSLEPPGAPQVLVDTPILNLSLQSLLLTRSVSVPWNWKVPSPTRELL